MKLFVAAFALTFVFAPMSGAESIKLKKIRFPTNYGATGGPTIPPTVAPLGQTIVFEFTGKPVLPPGVVDGIRIRVSNSNSGGQTPGELAFGDFSVVGNSIVFNPRLLTKALPNGYGPQSDPDLDASLPGLLPDTIYEIAVVVGSSNAVPNLTKVNVALPISFRTMPVVTGEFAVAAYFNNVTSSAPTVLAKKTKPKNGTKGIYPNPFEDAAGIFSGISTKKRPPFRLQFSTPLDPSVTNVSREHIRIRSIADAAGVPTDRLIGADVVLTSNSSKGGGVIVYPKGILPLGHTLSLEVSDKLRSIAGGVKNPVPGAPVFKSVATYRVANDPTSLPIDDRIVEDFSSNLRQDVSIAAEGLQLASWDAKDTNHLRASFGFGGNGSLGRFVAPNQPFTINLDTDFQQFPLFSGATPDVPPGTSVAGGVFNFTDFRLPPNATLRVRGTNPCVITCTGDVVIEGLIDINGSTGIGDNTFDSAITATPGGSAGPGGGRGGDSHPVKLPGGALIKYMQTPQSAQSGFGPRNTPNGGGGGGQNGCSLPWIGFVSVPSCANYGAAGDGSRGSGGGGGSFNVFFPLADGAQNPTLLISGRRGAIGIGNHLPVVFDADETPIPVAPEPFTYQAGPGNPTNALARANPNPTFTAAYLAGLIFDKGTMNVVGHPWAESHRVTFGGEPGPIPFVDSDDANNFVGPGGELSMLIGGQGGGGGGSRTEGSTYVCAASIFNGLGLPFTVNDSKGGGGGGGGGALMIQAIGPITFLGPAAKIEAKGGDGAGGEQTEDSIRGGSSGGGSGGCVILQSATDIVMNDAALPARVIDVSGGCGHDAALLAGGTNGIPGADNGVLQFADGGPGGPGLVQIHTPSDAQVDKGRIGADYFPTVLNVNCGGTNDGRQNLPGVLVPTSKTPTPLTSQSVARSVWYDLGAVTSDFRPTIPTSAGSLPGPLFGIPGVGPFFKGTSTATGLVTTGPSGFVIDPFSNDIEVDSPDLLLPDFIPQAAPYYQSVRVRFQGADEDAGNPGSPNLASATPFVTDATLLNGKRHVRWEITFDIATDPKFPASPTTPRPQVNLFRLPFKY